MRVKRRNRDSMIEKLTCRSRFGLWVLCLQMVMCGVVSFATFTQPNLIGYGGQGQGFYISTARFCDAKGVVLAWLFPVVVIGWHMYRGIRVAPLILLGIFVLQILYPLWREHERPGGFAWQPWAITEHDWWFAAIRLDRSYAPYVAVLVASGLLLWPFRARRRFARFLFEEIRFRFSLADVLWMMFVIACVFAVFRVLWLPYSDPIRDFSELP